MLVLGKHFDNSKYVSQEQCKTLAQRLGMKEKQIKVFPADLQKIHWKIGEFVTGKDRASSHHLQDWMMNGSFGELENVRFPGNVIPLGDLVKQENLG